MFHAFGGSTGPNPDPAHANMLRLVERHFISQLPSTANKARAQRKCVRCRKMGIRKDTRFWCAKCNVALCLNQCFEIYHTKKDITKQYDNESDSE